MLKKLCFNELKIMQQTWELAFKYILKNRRTKLLENTLIAQAFIDKNKDVILVPYKLCKFGYALAVEPYKKVNNAEWDNISKNVSELLREISEQPRTELTETTVMKEICGNKGFKQFSKKHICIEIKYTVDEEKYTISNQPRLSDGSYGTEKNSVSEKFCIEHISTGDIALIQENFLKAYNDAEQYLQEIGSKL